MKSFITYLIFVAALFFSSKTFSQTATFITLNSGGTFTRVTIGSGGCTTTPLSLCSNFIGSALSIALDGNTLYIVDNKGYLYKNTLTSTGTVGNCTQIGRYNSYSLIATGINYYGLTVGPGGIVYAAIDGVIESYNPANNSFNALGTLPNGWVIGGDLLFYQGKLFEAVKTNSLVEINLSNVSNSTLYMNFNAGSNVYGFASVTIPCANNQAYAISTNGSNTDIYAVDMINKIQSSASTCTLPFKVNDAASLAETQSSKPVYNDTLKLFNCDSVTYKNIWYKTTTNFNDTLKGIAGCDSVYRLVDIKIGGKTSSTFLKDTTGSYKWNGVTYTQSSTYTRTGLINSDGCDSSATLVLTITQTNPCWKVASAHLNHSLAIKNDGTLWGWGANDYGQLGDGTNTNKLIPTQIGTEKNWVKVSAGFYFSLAIKKDGTLWAWGWNSVGELGDGTYIDRNRPVKIGADSNWVNISAGTNHAVAIKSDGSLWAWGKNDDGQLGNGTNLDKNIPIQIGIEKNWAKIGKLGSYFTLAIKKDSTLWAWGYNQWGQLGNGTNSATNTPTQIGTDKKWTQINCGEHHSVAIKADSSLWAWGYNYNGELGDGTKVDKNTPIRIGTGNSWANVILASHSTIGMHYDSTLWAWGYNQWGQLGDGTNSDKIIPIQISTNNNWAFINSGAFHSIAIKQDGTLWAWGVNLEGELGDGTTIDKNTPTLIINGCNPCPVAIKDTLNFSSSSCSSITYKTKTYTKSTLFTDTTKSYRGCDSIYTLVNINITSNILKDTLVKLSGCNRIVYKNNNYDTSITFIDTVIKTSNGNCDSIYHYASITINKVNAVTKTNYIYDCKTVLFNGKPYNSSATVNDTIKSYQGCDSIYNITNIVIMPTIAASKTSNLLSCKSIVYNGKPYNASTVVRDTIKSYYGCDSIYNIANIVIKPIIPVTNTINLQSCKTIVYNGKPYSISGVARDTIKSYHSCDSIYNVANILIQPLPTTIIVKNIEACNSTVYNGKTYTTSITIKDTISTLQGCDSIYNIVYISIKKITPLSLESTITNCKEIIYKGILYKYSTKILDTTIKSYQGCDSIYKYINIKISPLLVQHINKTFGNCDSVVFRAKTYHYGTIIFDTIRNNRGCDSVYVFNNITIYSKPKVNDSKYYVLPNQSVTLMPAYQNDDKYLWKPATYLDNPTHKYTLCIPKNSIDYNVTVYSDKGCTDTGIITVIVGQSINIPNIFSPNGDRINDTWVIENIDSYKNNNVKIFDRFGQLVISTNNYQSWDGKRNGQNVPVGVYYYIIQLDPSMKLITGYVTIFR